MKVLIAWGPPLVSPAVVGLILVSFLCVCSIEASSAVRDDEVQHTGWTACRLPLDPSQGCSSSLMNISSLPTTALAVLLENQRIAGAEHLRIQDIYYSTNLKLLPDISLVGRAYYTLLYELAIPAPAPALNTTSTRQTLRLAGVNYRASAWLDGTLLPDLNFDAPPGMFVRRFFDVTGGGRFNLLIQPPDHPGAPTRNSQGGDHALAQDGATAQYMLGWDWSQAMPDRATGFFGSVVLSTSGPLAIVDPAIQTVRLECHTGAAALHLQHYFSKNMNECSSVTLRIMARIEGLDGNAAPQLLRVKADWGESWNVVAKSDRAWANINLEVTVKRLNELKLWWPHSVLGIDNDGDAHLHSFQFSLIANGNVSDRRTIRVGIRTVETFLDDTLQGQRFRINGMNDVYLVGGNWIGTDQALRYSASTQRYCDEIALHRHAGLNLIRVWGGGTAERDQFYDCTDRLGILVFQEFWMTGDNNGRWAGSYSWPLDFGAYLENVEDTVKRLRGHASLLFYGGCNECLAPRSSEWFPNPPRAIDDEIRAILDQYDPERFYIASSMGGANKADTFVDPSLWRNRSYSLAFTDGPYGMLLPETFYDRNPGLPFKNLSIGFQPEVGSASAPTLTGLLRFMGVEEIEAGYPRRNAIESRDEAWEFHKFLPWTTTLPSNDTYDHVYSYFPDNASVTAADWAAAAQIASHAQYQNLFNGFISRIFNYTTAVIMWKSQSPWPSLRGFLYDWYLESTGTLRGVRAAIGCPVSIVLDLQSRRLRIVNRQVVPLLECGNGPVGASYTWIDVHGTIVATGKMVLPSGGRVLAMTPSLLGGETDQLAWPESCTSVCFLLLQEIGNCRERQFSAWLWLTDATVGQASDYSLLGELRTRQMGGAKMQLTHCVVDLNGLRVGVLLSVESTAADVLFYPTFSVFRFIDGTPLLPLLDSMDSDVVVVPGASQRRLLRSSDAVGAGESILVVLTSWNAPIMSREIVCSAPDASLLRRSQLAPVDDTTRGGPTNAD